MSIKKRFDFMMKRLCMERERERDKVFLPFFSDVRANVHRREQTLCGPFVTQKEDRVQSNIKTVKTAIQRCWECTLYELSNVIICCMFTRLQHLRLSNIYL